MPLKLGLSFGKKKVNTNQTTTLARDEVTTQNQTQNQSQTGTTTSSSTGTQTGSSVGSQTSTNIGTNRTSGTMTGQSTQTTRAFSDPTLAAIEGAVQNLFGTVGRGAATSNFDPAAFVRDGVAAVQSEVNSGLESNINQLVSNLGGATDNNSMAALLSNRMRNDAAAQVAGVRANLTGQAEEIQRNNAIAGSQIKSVDQNFLGNLLQALKGGQVTTTGTESQQTAQNQQTQQEGGIRSTEQTAQQSSQQSTQVQELLSQLSQLINGTTSTRGTENVKGTQTSKGGGISLGT